MKDLFSLEIKLLDPAIRRNKRDLESLLAPSFIEIIPSGEIWSRDRIIEALLADTSSNTYSATDLKDHRISDDVVLLTYKARRSDQTSETIRSSIWKKNGNTWQMTFHQGTPII